MRSFQPFTDNVIFYDAEFTSLDPNKGEILSIGMIKITGEELYLEIEYDKSDLSDWVKEHVLEFLSGDTVSKEEARKQVAEFIGKKDPYLVSYVNQFDTIYLHKLFEIGDESIKNIPQHWIPLDFASVLFGLGANPEVKYKELREEMEKSGKIPEDYVKHHALSDARMLKEVYVHLVENIE